MASGTGAGLESLGSALMQFGMNRYQQKQNLADEERRRKAAQQEKQEYAEFIQRMNPPEERVREVFDQEKKLRMQIREQWQPGTGDQSQGPPAPGRWSEVDRQQALPKDKQSQITSFRRGDQTVTAVVDPDDPSNIQELGSGPTFDPRSHQGRSGGAARPGKLVRINQPDGTQAVMIQNSDGTLSAATDEEGNEVTGVGWRPREGKPQKKGSADAIGPAFDPEAGADVQFVDPAQKKGALSQLDGPQKTEAKPGSSKANPIQITSPEEADKYPPGTYVSLNGRVARVD